MAEEDTSSEEEASEEEDDCYHLMGNKTANVSDSEDDDEIFDCDTYGNTDALTGRARTLVHGSHNNIKQQTYQKVFNQVGHMSADGQSAVNKRIAQHLVREDVVLRNRGLTFDDAMAMAECLHLNSTVQYLDVSNNPLTARGAAEIAVSAVRGRIIKHLNLSAVKLGKSSVYSKAVAIVLKHNRALSTISLQKNDLKDHFVDTLHQSLLERTNPLKFLDLSHNSFDTTKSLTKLGEICSSSALTQLSLSWNNLRVSGPSFLGHLAQNAATVKLVALDLSYCGLSDSVAQHLGDLFASSKTLTSLDISHNRLYAKSASLISEGLKRNRVIQILHIGFNKLEEAGTLEVIQATKSAVKLKHLGIENTVVLSNSSGGDDRIQRVFEAGERVKRDRKTSLSVQVEFPPKFRVYQEKASKAKEAVAKALWTLQRSVFTPRLKDADSRAFYDFHNALSSTTLRKAFAIDMRRAKIEKIVKDELEMQKVRHVLQDNYVRIVEIFKYWSGQQLIGNEPFFMTTSTFAEVCEEAGLCDSETFGVADADRIYIAANVERTGLKMPSSLKSRNTIKVLVRYEWLEALVRIALRKFVESELETNASSALSRLLNEFFFSHAKHAHSDDWRSLRLYNEECDVVIRGYLETILAVYKRYSGKKNNPGERKCMSLSEWLKFISDYHLVDGDFTEREAKVAFVYSVPFAVDELHQTKASPDQLTLITFVECLARSVELMSPTKVTKIMPNVFGDGTAFHDTSFGAPAVSYPAIPEESGVYAGSEFWTSKSTPMAEQPKVHLSALLKGLFMFLKDAETNLHHIMDKMAAANSENIEALSLSDTLDAIGGLYQEKVEIAEEEGHSNHHHIPGEDNSLLGFCCRRLSDVQRKELQLSVIMHEAANQRVMWFGVVTGWGKSSSYPFDTLASGYFFDALIHLVGVDNIQEKLSDSSSSTKDAKEGGFIPADAVEACIMRLCGDVVPEEDMLQECYNEVKKTSENNRFFALGHQMLSIDEGLDILMRFWYDAIKDQLRM